MYVTCVGVKSRRALRQFQYYTTLADNALARVNTLEQPYIAAVGSPHLYTTFLERYRVALHKDEHISHLLDQCRTWNSHTVFLCSR